MDWKAFVAGSLLGFPTVPAHAGDTIEYADGTLNPQEMTVEHWVAEADRPVFDPRLRLYGYPAAKMGDHPGARKIFERCARHARGRTWRSVST